MGHSQASAGLMARSILVGFSSAARPFERKAIGAPHPGLSGVLWCY